MDNLLISSSQHQDTPPLCSNVILWEMDDVEAGEPLLLPQTAPASRNERNPDQNHLGSAPPVTFADAYALPDRQTRPADNLSTRLVGNNFELQRPFGSPHKPAEQLQSNSLAQRRSGTQGLAANTCASTPLDQHRGSAYPYIQTDSLARTRPSEMSFLDRYPQGNAKVCYTNDIGETESVGGMALEPFERTCPLLATAFETRDAGPHLYLEILTRTTALPFLRYIYTGSYAMICQSDGVYGDVPTSLLLHCQLYHLAAIFDLPQLMQQANVNIIRQCEFGCSSPDPPIHLCGAIKYAYEHLSNYPTVLDTIVSYCVACFLRHRLAEDEAFKHIAYDLKPFHQALCQESMKRKFENETAFAIIQMPFKRDAPEIYLSREDISPARMRDVVHHFHASDKFDYLKDAQAISRNTRPEHYNQSKESMANANAKRQLAKLETKDLPESSNISLLRGKDSPTTRPLLPDRPSPHRVRRPLHSEQTDGDGDSELFHLIDNNTTMAAGTDHASDLDYELVPGPASVESLCSESDSDSKMSSRDKSAPPLANGLPIRVRNGASSSGSSERSRRCDEASESSDSEWSLL